jgi:amidohydrolase
MLLPAISSHHEKAKAGVDRHSDTIVRIARGLHEHPEMGLEEHWAHAFLVEEARLAGFSVETPVAGLATAFLAHYDSGRPGPRIAYLCEYDAVPGLGHACGHNLISAGSFGAALALRPLVDELGGSVHIVGTPDEEAVRDDSKGGKVIMCQAGVFRRFDAALMMHPTGGPNIVWRYGFPLKDFNIRFTGKPAHYTRPEEGINALEALLLCINNLNTIKRSWAPAVLLACTITEGGGPSAITVPALAQAHYTLKVFSSAYMDRLYRQIETCVRAVAEMTGAVGQIEVLDEYKNTIPNLHLCASLERNLRSLGLPVEDPAESRRKLQRQHYPGASTDFSDVSWELPGIHGYCSIGAAAMVAHTPGFAAAAGSDAGMVAALNSARAMAMTGADILSLPEFAAGMKGEFEAYRASGFSMVPGIPPDFLAVPEGF